MFRSFLIPIYSFLRLGDMSKCVRKLLCTFFVVSIFTFSTEASRGKWNLVNPTLTGSAFHDVVFISPQEGWAVGENGIVVHTSDSGNTWTIQPTPVDYPAPLLSLAFINKDTLYAVGGVFGRTFALKSSNGGNVWIDATNDFPQGGLRKICIKNESVWVARWGRNPNLSVSYDRCQTWHHDTIGEGTLLNDILVVDDSIVIVCGDQGYIGKTTIDDEIWVNNRRSGVFIKLSYTSRMLYALGMRGQLESSDDKGDTWENIFSISGIQLNAMHFNENPATRINDGFVIGSFDPNIIIRIRDIPSVTPPEIIESAIQPQVTTLASPSENRSIGVCWNGAIHHLYGLADSSREVTVNTGHHIEVIDFHDSLKGICADEEGSLFLTADAGEIWKKIHGPDSSRVKTVVAFADGRTLLSTYNNDIFLSADYGNSWTIAQNTEFSLIIKKYKARSTEAYSSSGNSVLYTSDAGRNWIPRGDVVFNYNRDDDSFIGFYFQSKANGWALSKYGSVSRTLDSGYTWQPLTGISANIVAKDIFFTDSCHGWICGSWSGDGGLFKPLIFYTSDAGSSWTRQANIVFHNNLALPTDIPFQARMFKIRGDILASLWALSDKGILFSNDTGSTWQQQKVPQYGKYFITMFLSEYGDLFVTGDNSRIWKYTGSTDLKVKPTPHLVTHPKNILFGKVGGIYDLKGRKLNVNFPLNSLLSDNDLSGVYIILHSDGTKEYSLKYLNLRQ